MSDKVKLFAVDGIFTLSALGLLLYMTRMRWFASMGDGFVAFVIIVTCLIFFRFIAGLLIKRCKQESNNQNQIKNWQKILLTVAICEVFGLTTLTLLLFGGDLVGGLKDPTAIGRFYLLSCSFTTAIVMNFEFEHPSPFFVISLIFLIQFGIYAILGLFFSLFVCRKKAKIKYSQETE